MIRSPSLLALALAAAVTSTAVHAQSAHADLAAIDVQVAAFAGAAPGTLSPVDRRLRLAACPAPLALVWYGAQHDAVEVRCPAAGGWKIYVPRAGTGPASRPAAAAPLISRGDQVTITIAGQGFAVSQQGEALEGGAQGAWIKVRGLSAGGQVVRARVLRPGQVGMELP